jgi:hypothetical protein
VKRTADDPSRPVQRGARSFETKPKRVAGGLSAPERDSRPGGRSVSRTGNWAVGGAVRLVSSTWDTRWKFWSSDSRSSSPDATSIGSTPRVARLRWTVPRWWSCLPGARTRRRGVSWWGQRGKKAWPRGDVGRMLLLIRNNRRVPFEKKGNWHNENDRELSEKTSKYFYFYILYLKTKTESRMMLEFGSKTIRSENENRIENDVGNRKQNNSLENTSIIVRNE